MDNYALIDSETNDDTFIDESYESEEHEHCVICEESFNIYKYEFVWVGRTKIICNACLLMIKQV